MAEARKRAPSVSYRVTADGSHEIGAKIDGAFVPFVRMDAARVAQLAEREQHAAAADEEGDENGEEGG